MDLLTALNTVSSKNDLVAFLDMLRQNLETNPEQWENVTLGAYLEAISAWLHDMDGYFKNRNELTPVRPSWKTVAEILLAARTYE